MVAKKFGARRSRFCTEIVGVKGCTGNSVIDVLCGLEVLSIAAQSKCASWEISWVTGCEI